MIKPTVESKRDRKRAIPGEQARATSEPIAEQTTSRKISTLAPSLCGVTDLGRWRSTNEDAYGFSADGKLWVVADGMGGHAAGEVASALTVEAIMRPVAENPAEPASVATSVSALLAQAFARAHQAVSTHSMKHAACRGMGSTAVAAALDGKTLHICHVGDSRAYHLSVNRLRCVTKDHSWVGQLVTTGLLTPEQARTHPLRGNLLQAIGGTDGIAPDLSSVLLRAGDRVLLCSDGLWEALTDEQIKMTLAASGSLLDLASALVDQANEANGKDNITAIVYQHGATAETEDPEVWEPAPAA